MVDTPNLSYLYYKGYYDLGINNIEELKNLLIKEKNIFKEKNKKITSYKYINRKSNDNYIEGNALTFKLKTTYPGLLIGSGYAHEVGEICKVRLDDEYKMGFSFDYTTGLPIIPASSIKGVIKNAFRRIKESEKYKYNSYIKDLISYIINKEVTDTEIQMIENEIFEGKDDKGENIPINKRDIFFDGVIIQGDERGCLLGEDYITPHGEDELKAPKPIKFLKLLPDVSINFRFNVKDSILIEEFTKEKKILLFKNIIKDMGIGAKTNVGYGKLIE